MMDSQTLDNNETTKVKPQELIKYSRIREVPLVMQSEISECGLASLAMIASYYDHKTNLISLRKYINLGTQGINLKQLMNIASNLDLSSRAVKCDLKEIGQLKLPCIIHWDLDHFVVLTKVSKKSIHINDPAYGKRKLTLEKFGKSFTGIALELTPTTSFKKIDSRITMKLEQLWNKIIGLKRSLFSLILLSIAMQLIALASPYYMQWVVDTVLLSNDKPLLVVLSVGFAFLTIIRIFITSFRSWLVIRISSSINIQMGANLFSHLIRLPIDYFENRHIGDIVSKFGSLHSIKSLLTNGIVEVSIDGIMSIIVAVMMYIYSPTLLTIVLGFFLLRFISQWVFYYPNRRMTEESITSEAQESSKFLESIRAIQTIKLFSHEVDRQNTWINTYADTINSNIRIEKLAIAENAVNSLISALAMILVIYLGSLLVMNQELTIGMLLSFIAYKGQFTSNTSALINKIFTFKLIGLHLERLSDITLKNKERVNTLEDLSCKHFKGHLELVDVSYRYTDQSEWIFKNLSFEISPGESIAIIGSSGTGKSTLIKIILGLLKPTSGKVLIDGVDLNDLSLSEYRKLFGTVMQNDTLLSGSLAENLSMFDSSYDEDKIINCCKTACIWEEIINLPMGLNSSVGDMGNCFSGGQLQRIFLARALYKSPKILCLDESTSHLDQKNENYINDNIKKLNMTKIAIAHRKETIEKFSRIINLDNIKRESKVLT
ncbi:peptidase domain-containing ABC transporter [Vibrio alginolyticus]|uniref:peptidase domain-containing ABC transporter n=1 Tax=Vibrio alginolyticus TaxID=663 RepID=UPI00355394A9